MWDARQSLFDLVFKLDKFLKLCYFNRVNCRFLGWGFMKKLLLFSMSLLLPCFLLQSSSNDHRKIRVLQDAIRFADLDTVNRLIEEKINVNFADTNGTTFVHYASQVGNADILKALISAGALVEAKNKKGQAPLHHAVLAGRPDLAKYLVDFGVDKEVCDNTGATPLHYAAVNGRLEVAKYLVDSGLNKEACDNSGATPLHYAAGKGGLDLVKYLVESGVNKEPKNNNGSTPLHHAAGAGLVDVVSFLIDANVNKNFPSDSHLTPLHHAALNDRADVITLLIEKGAKKNARNINRRTPLFLAAVAEKSKSVKALIASGAKRVSFEGVNISDHINKLLNWYTPEIIAEEQTLFGQSVKKSFDEFENGHPELLSKVLGGSTDNDPSIFPATSITRARALFEPCDLENNIIPELRKQLPGLTIEGDEAIMTRNRDYLKSIKVRPRSNDDLETEDK